MAPATAPPTACRIASLAARACLLVALAALAGCGSDPVLDPAGMLQPNSAIVVTAAPYPPFIDGQLDDRAWQSAARVSGFINQQGKPAGRTTIAYVSYDRIALYVAFICDEPRIRNLVLLARDRDGAVDQDDSVQVLVSPDLIGPQFKSFAVSCTNVQADADETGPAWDASWPSEATVGAWRYQVEMAIPLAVLGVYPSPGDTWRLLLVRNTWTEAAPEVATHVHIGGDLRAVDRYAKLLFR